MKLKFLRECLKSSSSNQNSYFCCKNMQLTIASMFGVVSEFRGKRKTLQICHTVLQESLRSKGPRSGICSVSPFVGTSGMYCTCCLVQRLALENGGMLKLFVGHVERRRTLNTLKVFVSNIIFAPFPPHAHLPPSSTCLHCQHVEHLPMPTQW